MARCQEESTKQSVYIKASKWSMCKSKIQAKLFQTKKRQKYFGNLKAIDISVETPDETASKDTEFSL